MFKPKNDEKSKQSHIGIIQFLMLWLAGHIGGWLIAVAIYEMFEDFFQFGELPNALLIALMPGMIIALAEVFIVERGLKKSMRGWLPISFIGWLASAILYLDYSTKNVPNGGSEQILILFVTAAIAQFFWLWRRAKAAWLWVGAAVVSALVFMLPLNAAHQIDFAYRDILYFAVFALAAILQGAVTGFTMYLLQHQRKDEAAKLKIDRVAAFWAVPLRLQTDTLADDMDIEATETKKRHWNNLE